MFSALRYSRYRLSALTWMVRQGEGRDGRRERGGRDGGEGREGGRRRETNREGESGRQQGATAQSGCGDGGKQ